MDLGVALQSGRGSDGAGRGLVGSGRVLLVLGGAWWVWAWFGAIGRGLVEPGVVYANCVGSLNRHGFDGLDVFDGTGRDLVQLGVVW